LNNQNYMPENQRIDTSLWDKDEQVEWDCDNSSVEMLEEDDEE